MLQHHGYNCSCTRRALSAADEDYFVSLYQHHGHKFSSSKIFSNTAQHGAAGRGDSEMARYLLESGARVDAINYDGNSPADMAFGPSRFFIPKPETVDLLVAMGSPFQDNCRSDQCVDGKFFGGTGIVAPK